MENRHQYSLTANKDCEKELEYKGCLFGWNTLAANPNPQPSPNSTARLKAIIAFF